MATKKIPLGAAAAGFFLRDRVLTVQNPRPIRLKSLQPVDADTLPQSRIL
jgi:hypothetical protein